MRKKKNKLVRKLENIKYRMVGKKDRRDPFFFEIHIIDACNLNCAGCDHFAPLAPKDSEYPLDEFKKDLSRMYEIFGENAIQLHIMGGEPLLCKNINEYLNVARMCMPTTNLELITNATLLKGMPESFYETCKQNNVKICVSTYPINIDYDELYEFVKSKGVEIETFNVRTTQNIWKNMGLSKTKLLNYKKTFLECKYANNCSNLRHGKLYFCPHAAYIDLFNKYFDETYDNSGTGISIYE